MPSFKSSEFRVKQSLPLLCKGQSSEKKAVDHKGFTLVELMVVISIMGLLSAIGLTIFSQAQVAARDSRRVADMEQTQKALEQFYTINAHYISLTTTARNNVLLSTLTDATTGNLSTYYQTNTLPADPNPTLVSGYDYRYFSCNSPATQFIVCARLESCGGKCNMAAAGPADGCATLGTFGSQTGANSLYCLRSLSN